MSCTVRERVEGIVESEVDITTPDGACDAYFAHPQAGASPAVLVWPDVSGLRPAFRQMGKRCRRGLHGLEKCDDGAAQRRVRRSRS